MNSIGSARPDYGRWYLRYSLSYRDVQELMAERGLSVDHSTVWRWVQRYAPILNSSDMRRSSTSGFAEKCAIPIGPGA